MSKGGGQPQTQTTEASIPDAFYPYIFGTAAPQRPTGGGGGFLPTPTGFLVNALSGGGGSGGGRSQGEMLTNSINPSQGVLPNAVDLFQRGMLAPTPSFGESTLDSITKGKELVGQYEGQFLPQVQGIFDSFGEQAGGIADIATATLQRQLERNTLPSIGQGALAAGMTGSSRQGIAEGLATAEANRDITDARAKILFAGADRQLGFAPQLAQLLGMPTQLLGQIGAQEDQIANATNEAEFQNLLRYAQLIQGFIPGATQTTTQEQKSGAGVGGAIGAGAATFAATSNPWLAGGAALLSLLGG